MDYEEIPSEKELQRIGRSVLTSDNPEKEIVNQLRKLNKRKTKELSITNGFMTVKGESNGSVTIICHGQKVLNIGEVSDDNTINLFFHTIGKSNIADCKDMETDQRKGRFQLLCERNKTSKKKFKENTPVYKLTGKKRRSLIQTLRKIQSLKQE